MPMFTYKCSDCGFTNDYIVGKTTGTEAPTDCPECNAQDTMEKQFSMNGISGEVVGGYDYEYGKKAWKKNTSMAEKAGILAGDASPY